MTAKIGKQRLLDAMLAEHHRMIEILSGLAPDEWDRPSACEKWSVAQLTAHMVIGDGIPWGMAWGLLAYRSIGKWMDQEIADLVHGGTDKMLDTLRRRDIPAFARLGNMGRMLMYIEILVHYEDMRRPLDRPRTAPPDPEVTWAAVRFLCPGQLKRLKAGGGLALEDGGTRLGLRVRPGKKARWLDDAGRPDAVVRGDPLENLCSSPDAPTPPAWKETAPWPRRCAARPSGSSAAPRRK